jgi:hypothetical protein
MTRFMFLEMNAKNLLGIVLSMKLKETTLIP